MYDSIILLIHCSIYSQIYHIFPHIMHTCVSPNSKELTLHIYLSVILLEATTKNFVTY